MQLPTIIIHDVLQSELFSPAQKSALETKSFLDWFIEMVTIIEDEPLVLSVVAEGVSKNPAWVEYIKAHPHWKIQCHGYEHRSHNFMPRETIFEHMVKAKKILEDTFGQSITEMHPPKHRSSQDLVEACEAVGMKVVIMKNETTDWINEPSMRFDQVYTHFWKPKCIEHIKLIKEICRHQQETI